MTPDKTPIELNEDGYRKNKKANRSGHPLASRLSVNSKEWKLITLAPVWGSQSWGSDPLPREARQLLRAWRLLH